MKLEMAEWKFEKVFLPNSSTGHKLVVNTLFFNEAAVLCSPIPYWLGGVGLGLGLTGKLGRAWVGAWVVVM